MWVISYLDLAIIAFTDLLQSPLKPLQFRLAHPLHSANGLYSPATLPKSVSVQEAG